MSRVKDVEELGIELSDELKELLHLDEMLSSEQDENAKLQGQVLRLNNELKIVKEERDELKEALCEVDPDFADVVYGGDRGNEMKHDSMR